MIKRDSRQYAKRQMTFFRKLPGIEWIDPEPAAFASRFRHCPGGRLRAIVPSFMRIDYEAQL